MIQLALAFHDHDGNYALHAAATLVSVLKNTSAKINIHIVHDSGLDKNARNRLAATARYFDQSINFYEVTPPDAQTAAIMPPQLGIGSLYRLHLPRLLRKGHVIYLDCDICCMLDIEELWQRALNALSLKNQPLLAWTLNANRAKNKAPAYFNTGVMAMHIKEINARFPDLAHATLRTMPYVKGPLLYPDQDALNALMRNLPYDELEEKYNFQLHVDQRWLLTEKELTGKIAHYCGKKPWCEPFYPSVMPHLQNYRLLETIFNK